jgi:TolB-like protein/Tfp pilus assembly protein PilF
VLPFEHQGDSTDAYITEGLSDELRGRLAGVRDLSVIARGSSVQYRGTTKSPREIAEELGVRWLLTATVQVSGTGDTRRVIVRPELVEVGADGQPRTRWGEPFDAQGADALRLQGDIAGRVVDAMEVKLAGADRARTIAVPTTDPAAYDAYLRGRAATEWGTNQRVAALERATPYFEEAVQRDPAFVDAWLGVAFVRTLRVVNGRANDPALVAQAEEAVERVERLAPGSPQALLARSYHARTIARDYEATRVVLERGARVAPGDYRFAGNLGLLLLQNLGRSEEALPHFSRAAALDPGNASLFYNLSSALRATGRLAEARVAADRALELRPGSASIVTSWHSMRPRRVRTAPSGR